MKKEEKQLSKQKYQGIDLFKFIMSILVIAIHTHPLENSTNIVLNTIYTVFVKMAVPFFFIASGYLLAIKLETPFNSEKNINALKNYLKKIIKMYITWTIIYAPIAIYKYIDTGTTFAKALFAYVRNFIFVGENYNSWILWYLLSTIYALIIIIFLIKKRLSLPKVFIVGCLSLIISFAIDIFMGYNGMLPSIFVITRKIIAFTIKNGRILTGMFYIALGMFIANKKISNIASYIMFIVGFIANYFIKDNLISSILLIIHVTGLFGIAKSIKLKPSLVYPFLREMSTEIYLIHLYIWTIYYKITYNTKTFGMDSFLITTITCLIISFIIVYYKNKRRLSNCKM